jgi:hypothetical protein
VNKGKKQANEESNWGKKMEANQTKRGIQSTAGQIEPF